VAPGRFAVETPKAAGKGRALIDLHSHILFGVDDGAKTLEDSLAMGRLAAADGIHVMACTPHFMLGMYDNEANAIRHRVAELNMIFEQEGIDVALVTGSDAHIRPDFVQALRGGEILTLHDSRYVLVEPPHNVLPNRLDDLFFNIQASGFVPILTHPERLKWIERDYQFMVNAHKSGVWMQITAGSLTGRMGARPEYWAKRMLSEGLVHIIASDAHNTRARPPVLSEAFEIATSELGLDEATHLVVTRPTSVLDNAPPGAVPDLRVEPTRLAKASGGFLRRLFGGSL
jgi:protein-tyrosine phosphatase